MELGEGGNNELEGGGEELQERGKPSIDADGPPATDTVGLDKMKGNMGLDLTWPSFESAFEHLKFFGALNNFVVKIMGFQRRDSKHRVTRVRVGCTFAGKPDKRHKGIKTHLRQCPFQIQLNCTIDRNGVEKWFINTSVQATHLFHSCHPFDEDSYEVCAGTRQLPPNVKSFVRGLREEPICPEAAAREFPGIAIDSEMVCSLWRVCDIESVADLCELFDSSSDFRGKIVKDANTGRLKRAVWVCKAAADTFRLNHKVIVCDATYKTNRYCVSAGLSMEQMAPVRLTLLVGK